MEQSENLFLDVWSEFHNVHDLNVHDDQLKHEVLSHYTALNGKISLVQELRTFARRASPPFWTETLSLRGAHESAFGFVHAFGDLRSVMHIDIVLQIRVPRGRISRTWKNFTPIWLCLVSIQIRIAEPTCFGFLDLP